MFIYSSWSKLPPIILSVPGTGLFAFKRVINELSPVLACEVAVTNK
jgi:hypothetical protein